MPNCISVIDISNNSIVKLAKLDPKKDHVDDIDWIQNSESLITLSDHQIKVYDTSLIQDPDTKWPKLDTKFSSIGTIHKNPNVLKSFAVCYGEDIFFMDSFNQEILKIFKIPCCSPKPSISFEWIKETKDLFMLVDKNVENPRIYFGILEESKKTKDNKQILSTELRILKVKEIKGNIGAITNIPQTQKVMILFKNGQFHEFCYRLKEYPMAIINQENEICFSFNKDIYTMKLPYEIETKNSSVWTTQEYVEDKKADILQLIIQRAKHGYGLDLFKNAEISQNFSDPNLCEIWQFFATCFALSRENKKIEYLTTVNPFFGLKKCISYKNFDTGVTQFNNFISFYKNDFRSFLLNCINWSQFLGTSPKLHVFFIIYAKYIEIM